MPNGLVSLTIDPYQGSVATTSTDQRLAVEKTLKHSGSVTSTTGAGIFVFFPGNVRGVLCCHYSYDDGEYTFDQAITLQNLTTTFDQAVVVGFATEVKASLQAVIGAVSGIVSAAYRECNPSELLPLPTVSQLANLTNQPLDTLGTVTLAGGASGRYFPSPSTRFTRLNDNAPSASGATDVVICDGGADLVYNATIAGANFETTQLVGPELNLTADWEDATVLGTFNVDGWDGLGVSGNITFCTSGDSTVHAWGAPLVIALVVFGLDQKTVLDVIIVGSFTPSPAASNANPLFWGNATGAGSVTIQGQYINCPVSGFGPSAKCPTGYSHPIGMVSLRASFAPPGVGGAPNAVANFSVASGEVAVRSLNTSTRATCTNPTLMFAYEGCAANTQITLSGVTRYLCVPNPEAAQNLTLRAYQSLQDLDYYSYILENRDRFNLRTVDSTASFDRSLAISRVLGQPERLTREEAHSWGWGDIWGGIKKAAGVVLPELGKAALHMAPMLLASSQRGAETVHPPPENISAQESSIGRRRRRPAAASGQVRSATVGRIESRPSALSAGGRTRAASRVIQGFRHPMNREQAVRALTALADEVQQIHLGEPRAARQPRKSGAHAASVVTPEQRSRISVSPAKERRGALVPLGGYLFPTVLTGPEGDVTGAAPYLAVPWDVSRLLSPEAAAVTTPTLDGFVVRGASVDPSDSAQSFPATGTDVTILPVVVHDGETFLRPGPPPVGHSCDLALSLLAHRQPATTPNALLTGTVSNGKVGPVLGVAQKLRLSDVGRIPMLGAVPDLLASDGFIETIGTPTVQHAAEALARYYPAAQMNRTQTARANAFLREVRGTHDCFFP